MFRNRLLLSAPQKQAESMLPSDSITTLADMEKSHIAQVLSLTNNNYTEASKKLGISRSTLWRKVKDYHLEAR
jgi:transcriptional regulator of acetoin/glycerol metabolism